MRVMMKLNSEPVMADGVCGGESLLRLLRDRLGTLGPKGACEQGECGSCTVLLDGVSVNSCLVAAGQADGASVETIEGLGAAADGLTPLQSAFTEAGAIQCGFCIPGFIVAAQALIDRGPDPSDNDIREALAGNLCRCTGYQKIVEAVKTAARAQRAVGQP